MPLGDILKSLKILYAGYIVYNLGITMIRFSAILFYNRVFEPRKTERYRYFIWLGLGLNTAWILAFGAVALLPCLPIHAFWDRPLLMPSSYRCSSTLAIQLSAGITSVLMDLLVLLLPVPPLLELHTDWRKKARLVFVFLLGYWYVVRPSQCLIWIPPPQTPHLTSFIALSSLRSAGLYPLRKQGKRSTEISPVSRHLLPPTPADSITDKQLTAPGAFVTTLYWFTCEISVASIGISLPIIFRLVKRATSHGPAALLNDREYPTKFSGPRRIKGAGGDNDFVRLTNGAKDERVHEIQLNRLESGHS